MSIKEKAKSALSPEVYQRLRGGKIVLRRQWLFYTKGIRYLTLGAVFKRLKQKIGNLAWRLRGCPGNKILWVGCFPYWHRNVGDQAQTLALEKFFKDKYPDHHVITVTRNDVGSTRWDQVVKKTNSDDLIMIHSTGDFGSKYYSNKVYAGGLSWAEVRKKIVATFPDNKIVQLPVTVLYGDNPEGDEVTADDRVAFNGRNFTVLCRESTSLEILTQRDICHHQFFPDFVFYLKPEMSNKPRAGILLLLRGKDKESLFNEVDKEHIKVLLESVTPNVEVNDIMKADFPLPPMIRENFINSVMQKYQNYELVVTDRMHGMILAVITNTPCIALDEAIPHKLSGYRDMLNETVTFVSDIHEIPLEAKRVLKSPYVKINFWDHFERFRKDLLTGSESPIEKIE